MNIFILDEMKYIISIDLKIKSIIIKIIIIKYILYYFNNNI